MRRRSSFVPQLSACTICCVGGSKESRQILWQLHLPALWDFPLSLTVSRHEFIHPFLCLITLPLRAFCVCAHVWRCPRLSEKANDAQSPLQALIIPWQKCNVWTAFTGVRVSFISLRVGLNKCVKLSFSATPLQLCPVGSVVLSELHFCLSNQSLHSSTVQPEAHFCQNTFSSQTIICPAPTYCCCARQAFQVCSLQW